MKNGRKKLMRQPDYLNIFFGGLVYSISAISLSYAVTGHITFRVYAIFISISFILSTHNPLLTKKF